MRQYEMGGENMTGGEAAFENQEEIFEVKVNLSGQIFKEITTAKNEEDARVHVANRLQKENPTVSYVYSRVINEAVVKRMENKKSGIRVIKGGKGQEGSKNAISGSRAEDPEQPELF